MSAPATPIHDTDELSPGTRLLESRLTISARIGRGGAATVYLARTSSGRDVALKILSSEVADEYAARQRFRNEAAFARFMVDCPRVVTPYEVGTVPELGDRLYMTMPFIKGRPLFVLAGQLELREAVALLRDVAAAVAEVHQRGIVHRDIKPANVLVGGDRDATKVPYLIDFGVAWTSHSSEVPVSGDLTTNHELPGTKHYMAPEQVLGVRPTPRFDVYALGITALEVLSGAVPFEDLEPQAIAKRKCDHSLPSLSAAMFMPGLPRDLQAAIDAALQRDPAARTPDANRFAEHLTGVLARLDSPSVVPAAPLMMPIAAEGQPTLAADTGDRERKPGLALSVGVAVAVLALVALVGGVLFLFGPQFSGEATIESSAPTVARMAASTTAIAAGSTDTGGEVDASTGAEAAAIAPPDVPDVEVEPLAVPDVPAEAPRPTPVPAPRPCPDVSGQAADAMKAQDWHGVLRLVKKGRCWEDKNHRAWLHVFALAELSRYSECVKVGGRSRSPGVARLVAACRKKLDEGNND